MKDGSVAVIIPNWNGKKLLQRCLISLKKQRYLKLETIVVDNGSTDGSVEMLKSKYSSVKVIRFKKNLGFASAVNEGIKASDSEFIVLLNNDAEVEKDFFKIMVNFFKSKQEIYGVAPKVLNYFNPKIIDSAGDKMNVVGQAFHRGYGEKSVNWNNSEEVFLVTAGASMFRREVFGKVGFFDKDYFAYGEDVDWCFRAQMMGCKFFYEPKAVVYHRHKSTSRRIPKKVEHLQFRNMTMTILKDFPFTLFLKKWRFIILPLVHFNTILYMALHGFLKEALMADFWNIIHLPKILYKRWEIQRSRKVSVKYLDNWMEPKKIRLWGLIK